VTSLFGLENKPWSPSPWLVTVLTELSTEFYACFIACISVVITEKQYAKYNEVRSLQILWPWRKHPLLIVNDETVKKCYHQSAGMATGYVLDSQGSIPDESKIFLFSTASRLALGSNQPPIQWVPGTISPGVKWLGREADHSPPFSAKVKNGRALHMSSWHCA
jgi:hypothetical protein